MKHQLKRVHILPNIDSLSVTLEGLGKTFSLTKDQTNQLQEAIIRISGGQKADGPDLYKAKKENEGLLAKLRVLEKSGFDEIKAHMEKIIQDMAKTGSLGGGLS